MLAAIGVLLACSAPLAAQSGSLTATMEADLGDATARTQGTSREDVNGERCAIIKLDLNPGWKYEEFMFEAGGSVGVVATVPKTGQIWIYLSPGTRRITISHGYLGVLRNFAFEPLKGGVVYLMKLHPPDDVEHVRKQVVNENYLVISCLTEGARLRIDKEGEFEPFGGSGMLTKSLPYGEYEIYVEADKWYHPHAEKIKIAKGDAVNKTITLKPKFGALTINTSPEQGATIYIDDEKQTDATPLTVERVLGGERTIRAIREFYREKKATVVVDEGQSKEITIELLPNFAEITLLSPQGGTIYINDEEKGAAQWTGRLKAANYKVEVKKASYRSPGEIPLSVVAGKNDTITLPDLKPIYGVLAVEANVGAEISIDDKPTNKRTPYIFDNILTGEHTVSLKAKGYKRASSTVTVAEDKKATAKLTLQEEDKIARLSIRANVAAAVTADGKAVGITPTVLSNIQLGQAPKTVALTFSAKGFETINKTVTLESGDNDVYVELEEVQAAQLSIRANVTATVAANGKTVGTTPTTLSNIQIKKNSNTVDLELSAKGYKTERKTVTLHAGANFVNINLEEIATGTLKISANTTARVEVDGKFEGYTPTNLYKVPLGTRRISFSANHHQPDEKSVYVSPGSNSVRGYLKPQSLPTFFADYQMSLTTAGGFSLGYCRRLGAYLQFRGGLMDVSAGELSEAASSMSLTKSDVSELEKKYFRRAYTAGAMLRLTRSLYAYGGLGFGQYGVAYKLGESSYYCPQILDGLEWEVGAKLKLSILSVNLGYNAISDSKFGELHFGTGLAFDDVTTEGFIGSNDRHEAFGGFHLRAGYGVCSVEDFHESIYRLDLHYNNSISFGINADLGVAFGDNISLFNAGFYSSYFIGDHFAVDYGLGYQLGEIIREKFSPGGGYTSETLTCNQPYFKMGASVMFNGNSWGGFSYHYTRGFGTTTPAIATHNLSYTVGQFPTLVIGGVTLTVGLIALLAVLGGDSESTN
ncbi:MAG: PEGA domain-containing protein [Prevotellaceae bacterium]|nr:PEGA domain-containing protein [Prevotellaceae bacterium]